MTGSRKSRPTTLRIAAALASAGALGVVLAGCTPDEPVSDVKGTTPPVISDVPLPPGSVENQDNVPTGQQAKAEIKNEDGDRVGEATFVARGAGGPVTVTVKVAGGDIPAGFHGMHIHTNGQCAPGPDGEAFSAAGGHLQVGDANAHPSSGDLISMNILKDGTGETVTVTDAVTLQQIIGKSIIIHEKPDNFGNVPNPSPNTLKTGDAGARLACGVIELGA
ncbi:superoxide dismutase family protein [Gordonia sp. NPDC003585]|uniref:superoxide dismutase family protein n=1 Tax=Gordonia sp. NPDC003585 TaxID=3154275 RepID=UPI0033A7ADE0